MFSNLCEPADISWLVISSKGFFMWQTSDKCLKNEYECLRMDKCEFLSTMFTQETQFTSMYISQNKTLYWVPSPLPAEKALKGLHMEVHQKTY